MSFFWRLNQVNRHLTLRERVIEEYVEKKNRYASSSTRKRKDLISVR